MENCSENATGIITGTTNLNTWNDPIMVDVIETINSVEMIYKETSTGWATPNYYNASLEVRVFKTVFSCVDGKWNKSDRIYGEIISASDESYEFE
jgi:hypothetical protein